MIYFLPVYPDMQIQCITFAQGVVRDWGGGGGWGGGWSEDQPQAVTDPSRCQWWQLSVKVAGLLDEIIKLGSSMTLLMSN